MEEQTGRNAIVKECIKVNCIFVSQQPDSEPEEFLAKFILYFVYGLFCVCVKPYISYKRTLTHNQVNLLVVSSPRHLNRNDLCQFQQHFGLSANDCKWTHDALATHSTHYSSLLQSMSPRSCIAIEIRLR